MKQNIFYPENNIFDDESWKVEPQKTYTKAEVLQNEYDLCNSEIDEFNQKLHEYLNGDLDVQDVKRKFDSLLYGLEIFLKNRKKYHEKNGSLPVLK